MENDEPPRVLPQGLVSTLEKPVIELRG